jgi:predicted ATP-grasp superfamily ATP-dependent carboligase
VSVDGTLASSRIRPLACVIGEIDLVRALGLAGIPLVVVSPPGDFTRYSRFTRTSIDWIDPWRRPDELVDRVMAFGQSQPTKPVLYYNGDWDLLVVSRFRKRLREAFRFVVPEERLVEDIVDKARFQRLAEEHDLPTPTSLLLKPGSDSTSVALRYPVVVKPLTRQHATWKPFTDTKVIQSDTPADLATVWSRLDAAGIEALVQEAIPGPESQIESYHAYVDEDGTVVGEFTGKKIRTYPTHHGYSTALVITDAGDLAELGRDILRRLDLRGVAKLDFKRHPDDGRLYLLEINPRFNLWHHPGARAGVNIPELVYRDLVGLPRPQALAARPGVRWCSPWRDAQAAWAQNVPLLRWIPWALTCEAKCAISWDDPLPFLGACAYRAVGKLRFRSQEFQRAG